MSGILVVVSNCYNRPSFLRKLWYPCKKCREENVSNKGESVISDYNELHAGTLLFKLQTLAKCRKFTPAWVIEIKTVKHSETLK